MIGSSGPEKETRAMNQEQKVIRVKVGVLELAKQLGNVSAACRVMGSPRQLLPLQGTLRQGRRGGAARNLAAQAGLEEPGDAGDRGGGGRAGDRRAGVGSGARGQRAEKTRLEHLAGRGALCVAAS